MEFPLWAVFGLTSASLSAIMMLVQERLKINGFAMAFWNKVACITFMIPAVLYFGLPDNWVFYALVAGQAMLWVVSDVIFFTAIPKVGAGVVSRILPVSIILTFCLWFLFDPGLLSVYLETPVRSALVFVTLCASVYFATRLKHCPVSWEAFRLIWFVVFASIVGPIGFKLVTQHTNIQQGPFSFVFCEAVVMVTCWMIWYGLRRPVSRDILFSRESAKAGFIIGSVSSLMVASNFAAVFYVDNPGLIPAIKFTDTMIIMAVYKMTGRKETADVVAGLGIVGCAAAIIFLKAWPVS